MKTEFTQDSNIAHWGIPSLFETIIRCAIAAFALAIPAFDASASWTTAFVGTGNNQVRIADGRNDGHPHVYCGTEVGGIMGREFCYVAGEWTSYSLGGQWNYGANYTFAIGAARADGIKRVYTCAQGFNGRGEADFYEFTYAGLTWNTSTDFEDELPGYGVYANAIADGRHDGVNRLYVAGLDGFFYEYSWMTNAFHRLDMPTVSSTIWQLAFGNARNDGVSRLYGVTDEGSLLEWSNTGGTNWIMARTNFGAGPLGSVAIGNTHGDGINRIYVACSDAHVYELSYNNGVWGRRDLGYGGGVMRSVTIGNARNDGSQCVYAGNNDQMIYEFIYRNGSWSQNVVEVGPAGNAGLAVGPGRSDGVNRLYATFDNETLYEYTFQPGGSLLPFSIVSFQNGVVTWNSTNGVIYDLEWASDLSSNSWHQDWSSLSGIRATGSTTSAKAPMFLRVRARP